MYGEGITDTEIVHHEILDSVHVKCLHAFDRFRLLQKEKQSINDDTEDECDELAQQLIQAKVAGYEEQIEMS